LAVVDSFGKVVHQARVVSNRAAVGEILRGIGGTMHAVIEASYHGGMYDCLSEICAEVVLVHPARILTIVNAKIKTDSIDALTLAQMLRMDYNPEAMRRRQKSGPANACCGSACIWSACAPR